MKYVQPIGETANSGYSNGNTQDGTLGSIIPAQAIEHPMREIVNVITQSGLTPSADDNTQLYQALRRLLQPTGLIEIWSGEISDVPDGWLYCQGQPVSRTTYADLFALVGTKYGTGDGSTTFNVPNMTRRTVMGRQYNTDNWGVGDTGGSFSETVNTGNRTVSVSGTIANATVDISGSTDGHMLTISEMPSHHHIQRIAGGAVGPTVNAASTAAANAYGGGVTGNTGGNQSHDHDINITGTGSHNHAIDITSPAHNHSVTVDTTPPYIAMIYIIRT